MLVQLFKAAVGVTLSPVALVIDILTLPASADNHRNQGPFHRTAGMLSEAGKNVDSAVKSK